jgi:hypothetical protein
MTFTKLQSRWDHSRKGGTVRGAANRRARGRYRSLTLELLEDRITPTGNINNNPFGQIASSLDHDLGALQTQLSSVLDTSPALSSLPFVGQSLGDLDAAKFVNDLRTPVNIALQNLANTPFPSDATISNALFSVLGSGPNAPNGLNVIGDTNNNGSIGPDDVIVTHPAALGANGVEIEIRLQRDLVTATTPLTFSTGLPSLPFSVSTTGSVAVRVGFDYELAVQYNSDLTQTTFDTSALLDHFGGGPANLANPHHEMAVTVDATLPGGFSATAKIGFLQGTLQDIGNPSSSDPAQHTEFRGTFGLDGMDNLSSASLDGRADVNLRLSGGFGSNVNFPSIGADFQLHWVFDSSNPAANPPTVSFSNVSLDLGQFLSGVLTPILRGIQSATAPIAPLLDLITTPLPGISDISNFLGQGDVTLLTLASLVAGQSGYGPLATLVSTLAPIVEDVDKFPVGSGTIMIPLGGFDLSNTDLRTDTSAGDVNNLNLPNLTSLVPDDPSQVDLSQVLNNPQLPSALKSDLTNLTQSAVNFNFDFPILDNPASAVFGMLLGKDSDLVSVTADVKFSSNGSQAGGLSFAGVGFTFGGDVAVDAHLRLAYDTFGLRELIRDVGTGNGNLLTDITDGFYLDTSSYFKIAGDIHAGFGFSYGLVSVGAQGDIGTGNFGNDYIGITVNPQPGDKLRLGGITLSNFSTFGELDAGLSVTASLGFNSPVGFVGFSHTWGLASVTLLDLNPQDTQPPPPPVIASAPDASGQVTLYVGDLAPMRQVYGFYGGKPPIAADSLDGVGENYSIADVSDDASGETIAVSAFGITQTISGVRSILANGDLGDLTIDVRHGVNVPVFLYGGDGHANLSYAGTGNAELEAGQLSSTLIGGSGSNLLIGGPGGDELIAGSGPNVIEGGSGNNNIVVHAPNANTNLISGGTGPTNTLTVLEPPGSESISVTPLGGSFLQVVVTSFQPKILANLFVNNVTNLVLGGGGGSNLVTVGDLSQSALQDLYVDAGHADSFFDQSTLTLHGSPGADTLTASTAQDPATGQWPTYVAVSAPGGKTLTVRVTGFRSNDDVVLAGDGGGDDYHVILNPNMQEKITIQGGAAGANDSLRISGAALSGGSVSVTDTAVTFHYTQSFGTFSQPGTAEIDVGPNIRSLEVDAPDGGETITANRSSGSTQLYGGAGNDAFDVSGTSIFTLYGLDGVNSYVIHLPTFGGNTTIYSHALFDADTLVVDDSANFADISTDYTVAAGNVTRVDTLSFIGGLTLAAMSSVTFTAMGQVRLDTNTSPGIPAATHIEGTAAGTATTINEGTGVNDVYVSQAKKNLSLIAGPVMIAGSGYNRVWLYDQPNIFRIAQITVTPISLAITNAATINYSSVSEIDLFTPKTALIVDSLDISQGNVLGIQGALGRSFVAYNSSGYQVTSSLLPAVLFGNNLTSLNVVESGIAADFDVYDTPAAFPTTLQMGYSGEVTVHGTTGPLTIDGGPSTSQVFLGDPSPQGGLLAALNGVVTVNGGGGPVLLDVDYSGDVGLHHGRLTGGTLSGVAPTAIVLGTGIQTLTIHTSASQGSDFTVVDTPALATTFLDGGTGDDTDFVLATTGSLIVKPGAGNNTVNVGNAANNLDEIDSAVSVDGSGGFTALVLHDESTQDITNQESAGVDIFTLTNQVSFAVTASTVMRQNATHSETRLDPSLLLKGQKNVPSVRNISIFEYIGYQNLGALTINGGQSGSNLTALLVPIPGGGHRGNVFNIQGTAPGTVTTINAGSQSDTVNVGSPGNLLDPIQGALAINGQNGSNTLNVNDQSAADFHYYQVSATQVSRLNAQAQADMAPITYAGIQTLTVSAGSAGDYFDATSTRAGTSTSLNGGAGVDEFVVSGNSTLDDLKGPLTLHPNGGSYNSVELSDFLNPLGHTYNFAGTSLQRSGIALISWDPMAVGFYASDVATTVSHINVQSVAAGYAQTFALATNDILTVGSNAPGLGGNLGSILGSVVAETYAGQTGSVIVDNSGDTTAHPSVVVNTDFTSGNVVTGLAPAPLYFEQNTAATLDGGSGGNIFDVQSTATATSTTINTGSGGDTVNAGSGSGPVNVDNPGRLDPIQGPLTINGKGGNTALNVNDQGSASSHSYGVSATAVSRFSAAGIPDVAAITYAAIHTLTVNASTPAGNASASSITDVLYVYGTAAVTSTAINGGAGYNEFVFYGNDGTMNNVKGSVTLHSGGYFYDFVIFNDSVNMVGQTYNLTATSLKRSGIALITWDSMSQVILYTGAYQTAVDHVNVTSVSAGTFEPLALGTGDILTVGSNAPGLGGNLNSILGSVRAQNYAGQTATVIVDDSGDTAAHPNVVLDTAGIYGNILTGLAPAPMYLQLDPAAPTTIKGGSGNNVVTIQAPQPTSALTLDGGSGTNTLISSAATTNWQLTGANRGSVSGINFVNMQNLVGGPSSDTFAFVPQGRVTGSIDGGGGGDWLDYSQVTSNVTVNLATGAATSVAGGVANIQNVVGGAARNVLTGDAQGNILIGGPSTNVLTGGSGRSILIGGGGPSTITGGSGDDILIGGTVSFATRNAALMAILAEWQRTDETYAQRITNLRSGGGLNGSNNLILGQTVLGNGAADILTGGDGMDWFWSFQGDTITDLNRGGLETIN